MRIPSISIGILGTLILGCTANVIAAEPHERHATGGAGDDRVAVQVPDDRQVRMGIKIARVEATPVNYEVRAPGVVSIDESTETHFHTRVAGWIEEIHADSVGKMLNKGDPLLDLYSPDLVTTQSEYLAALAIGDAGREVAATALERLRYFGVPEREIRAITASRTPKRAITFESPISGFVVEKNAIRGLYVTPDVHLYYLADLSRLWVMATLYEADLASVHLGDGARIILPFDASHNYLGNVSYIYPDIDVRTRAGKARIIVENPDGMLKPGMYVNVELSKSLGELLTVSEDSVIDTGTRKLVFVRTTATRFEPREIETGPRINGRFVVRSGLVAGEELVAAATFLLDAESKLKAAVERGETTGGGHGGHAETPGKP